MGDAGTSDTVLGRVESIGVWRRGDERAPHKPLLLLLVLAHFSRGREAISFVEIEEPLRRLLQDFGPPRKAYHPEFPFWYLQSDGLWVLDRAEDLRPRKSSTSPTISSLRSVNPSGMLPEDVREELRRDRTLLPQVVHAILDAHFPSRSTTIF